MNRQQRRAKQARKRRYNGTKISTLGVKEKLSPRGGTDSPPRATGAAPNIPRDNASLNVQTDVNLTLRAMEIAQDKYTKGGARLSEAHREALMWLLARVNYVKRFQCTRNSRKDWKAHS